MSDLGWKHSCTVINSNTPPERNIQHPDPETIFPPPAPYSWLNMTQLPCVGWERADRTQRAIWFRGNFTCLLFWGGLHGPRLENSSASQEPGISGTLSFRALKHNFSQTTWSEMPPQWSWCWWRERSRALGCRATPGSSPGAVPTEDGKASQDSAVSERASPESPARWLGHWASWALWIFIKPMNRCRRRSRLKESALQVCQQTPR